MAEASLPQFTPGSEMRTTGRIRTVQTRPTGRGRETCNACQTAHLVHPSQGKRAPNLETGVGAVDVVRPFAFAGDPGNDRPEGVGPPTSYRLQHKWAESDVCLGAMGGRAKERVLQGLNRRKDVRKGRWIGHGRTQTQSTRYGKIPGLLTAAGTTGHSNAGRREGVEGSGGSGSGGRSSSIGS